MTVQATENRIGKVIVVTIFYHLFIYILTAFSYFLPICCFLPFKLKWKEKVFFFFLLFLNVFLMGNYLGHLGVILLIVSSCLYISLLDKSYLLNICVFIAAYLFCVVIENIFSLLWDTFIFPVSALTKSYPYYTMYIILFIVIEALICPPLAKLLHKLINKFRIRISKRYLILIVTNLAVCLFIFLFNVIIGGYIGYNRKIIIFDCILFGLYFLISTILIINIVKAHTIKLEMDMRQESYDRLQDYTNQVEHMYSSLRSFKHDYQNIMLTMSGYIETEDMEGLKGYFEKEIMPLNQQLSKSSANLNQLMNIKITEIKSIVSAKLLYAAELNINISIEVMEEISDISMDTVDLARLLGIFLDNAIEAALETETPTIHFAIIHSETEYLFMVANTFIDREIPFAALKQPSVSTKGGNRGIGLYNANEILSQYQNIIWDTEIKNSCFIQRLHITK